MKLKTLTAIIVSTTVTVFGSTSLASEPGTWNKPLLNNESFLIAQPGQSWEFFPQAGFQVEDFQHTGEGFSLQIAEVGTVSPQYIGVQVVSSSTISLNSEQDQTLRFAVKTNEDFSLKVRLGQKEAPYQSVIEENIFIPASGEFETQEITIPASTLATPFLHFQLGEAPPNTHVEVQDVVID